MYHLDDAGTFRISITADRAKYHNLRRDPWAALHVTQPDFYAYAVLEGDVELTEPAADPDDATVDELVWHYEQPSASTRTGTSSARRWSTTGGSSPACARPGRTG